MKLLHLHVRLAQDFTVLPDLITYLAPKGIVITLHGGSYPPSSSNPVPQSFKVSLTCAEATTDPQFSSYENGEVLVEWSSPVACGTTETPKEGESSGGGGKEKDTPIESVGNGLGFFFLMQVSAFSMLFLSSNAYLVP